MVDLLPRVLRFVEMWYTVRFTFPLISRLELKYGWAIVIWTWEGGPCDTLMLCCVNVHNRPCNNTRMPWCGIGM